MPAATWLPSSASVAGPPPDTETEEGRVRRRAAGEGDVADLRGHDAERLGDHAEEDVVGAASRAAGNGNLGGIGLERGRKVLRALEGRLCRNDQRQKLAGQARD